MKLNTEQYEFIKNLNDIQFSLSYEMDEDFLKSLTINERNELITNMELCKEHLMKMLPQSEVKINLIIDDNDFETKRKLNKKEYQNNKLNKIIKSGGYCLICGELDLTIIELHHINDSSYTVPLCSNCHHRYGIVNSYEHKCNIFKRIDNNIR